MNLRYRPEIDGLRAIAVLPVILFHAGFGTFSGGFVGVDVFFVISGFLITSIIAREVDAGTFSLWSFYERRARRILPALFLVVLVCIPFAWMWMLPSEMSAFSSSVVSVCLFASNVLFWRQSGYFDSAAELKPLLHTWSLSVEEQYYVFFPLAVLLLWRMGRRGVLFSLALTAMASFLLSEYASRNHPSANFYLLPTRAWEILAGALCTFAIPTISRSRSNALSALGLLAITFSIFFYSDNFPFPSSYALLPVLGTCAILLFADGETVVGRLLSLKPFVGIGVISYSAYLWHQPLFAFARLRSFSAPPSKLMFILAVASLVLAYLSWRYVELPARRRGRLPFPNRRALFFVLAPAAGALSLFGISGYLSAGYPQRLPPEIVADEQLMAPNRGLSDICDEGNSFSSSCRTSNQPEVLLWGDSFAMHLFDGLLASRPGLSLIQLTRSVCGPFIGIAPIRSGLSQSWPKDCLDFNDRVVELVKNTPSIKYAALSSPFGQFVDDDAYVLTRTGEVVRGREVALVAFQETLDTLKGLGVSPVVFSPPPNPGFDAGQCLLKAEWWGESESKCSFSLQQSIERQSAVREFLAKVKVNYQVVSLDDALCVEDVCSTRQGDTFVYRDGGHLSHEGSAYVGKKMDFYSLVSSPRDGIRNR